MRSFDTEPLKRISTTMYNSCWKMALSALGPITNSCNSCIVINGIKAQVQGRVGRFLFNVGKWGMHAYSPTRVGWCNWMDVPSSFIKFIGGPRGRCCCYWIGREMWERWGEGLFVLDEYWVTLLRSPHYTGVTSTINQRLNESRIVYDTWPLHAALGLQRYLYSDVYGAFTHVNGTN